MYIENKIYLLHKLHKSITSHISWYNEIYFASVVLESISVCNLPHHKTGHTAYVITYPIRGMTFYALSARN